MRARDLRVVALLLSPIAIAAACSSGSGSSTGYTGTSSRSSGAGNAGSGGGSTGGAGGGSSSGVTLTSSSGATGGMGGAASSSSGGTGGMGGAASSSSGGTGGATTGSGGMGGAASSSSSSTSTSSTSTSSTSSSSSSTSSTSSSSTSSTSGGPPTFGSACAPNPTVLTGTVYAPNGTDPIPRVRVYIPRSLPLNPYPAAYCDQCSSPIDQNVYVSTATGADGTFKLDLSSVPQSATVPLAIQIGRFRKVTQVAVTCSATPQAVVPATAQNLPGKSADGDIPKIAVSAGNADHLDAVLHGLGITEYDCFEGRKGAPNTGTSTCPLTATSRFIADVIQDGTIDGYHMAFLSCAPNAYKWAITPTASGGHGNDQATLTSNMSTWVSGGGRAFVTDTAYDYVAQPFPSDITWQGPGGSPQPVDGANVGCSPPDNTTGPATSYTVTVDEPLLAQWLSVGVHVLPTPTPSPAQVSILGFYNPWSAISSLNPGTTTLIADGTLPLDLGTNAFKCGTNSTLTMTDVPLTAKVEVPTCGRVIFSSYHTDVKAGPTSAQARIMEYLIFEAAYCHG